MVVDGEATEGFGFEAVLGAGRGVADSAEGGHFRESDKGEEEDEEEDEGRR